MIKSIYIDDFKKEFYFAGGKDNFSRDGLEALFEYLELDDSYGENYKLDTVELCGDFTEYESLEKLTEDYWEIETMEELQEKTIVISINDVSFIIRNF